MTPALLRGTPEHALPHECKQLTQEGLAASRTCRIAHALTWHMRALEVAHQLLIDADADVPMDDRLGAFAVARAFDAALGGFDAFKTGFTQAALTRFCSGWAWLTLNPPGKLAVESKANQDNPLMQGVGSGNTAILGLDAWEHAYHLKYQNRRPAYIAAFYNVIDWPEVARRHAQALQH